MRHASAAQPPSMRVDIFTVPLARDGDAVRALLLRHLRLPAACACVCSNNRAFHACWRNTRTVKPRHARLPPTRAMRVCHATPQSRRLR